ncbi:hypothetical protein RB195_009855 [Necator americanus]|uniref:Uncharacterized protein n=1 Tax=Necator americanus TaxID=51031 RepID=A0ABR1CV85_NECAM
MLGTILKNGMEGLKWNDMGAELMADSFVPLMTSFLQLLASPRQMIMLVEFDGKQGIDKSECSIHAYLSREMDKMLDQTFERGGEKQAAWEACKSVEASIEEYQEQAAPCSPL